MERKYISHLKAWLEGSNRKPIVIRGARQVGKTWVVRQLAVETNMDLIELNFERNPDYISLFDSNDPKRTLRNIRGRLNLNIEIENSLLFLDEIQAAPELLSQLRWFAEELPELAVLTAGSLLEFVLEDHEFSMPVGRITYLHMSPLSFEEFLLATGRSHQLEMIESMHVKECIPESIHYDLNDIFREYLFVGGMPAAINSWVTDNSFVELARIHSDLLTTYRDDFAKYSGKINVNILDDVLTAIPKMLGNKFIYNRVNKDVNAQSIKKSLDLLCKAKICHKVQATAANGIPLEAEVKDKFFKVILLDTGLCSALLDLDLHAVHQIKDINLINQGGISEQVAAQQLKTLSPFYKESRLFYWLREQRNASAEVDYILQHKGKIIPVEVKSGSTGALKSLHVFANTKNISSAIRINSDPLTLCEVKTQLPNNQKVTYQLLSLPFYLIEQIPKILSEVDM